MYYTSKVDRTSVCLPPRYVKVVQAADLSYTVYFETHKHKISKNMKKKKMQKLDRPPLVKILYKIFSSLKTPMKA